MSITIRKKNFFIEKKSVEMGQALENDYITASIAVTASNPYSGKYSEDLSELCDWSASHAEEFLGELLDVAGLTPEDVVCFGKSAIIGINGEIEHAAALLHPTFGTPMRKAVEGTTMIPGATKIGLPGCTIDVSINHKNIATSIDFCNNIELSVPDAPHSDEFIIVATVATGARPLKRTYKNAVDLSKL